MFNLQGSEIVFLLLIALVVLGPEKLPEAVRKFAKGYAEFRKMATGFQGELKSVLDEPMRELRGTADAVRQAVQMDGDLAQQAGTPATGTPASGANVPMVSGSAPAAAASNSGLDFGNVAERRRQRASGTGDADGGPDGSAASDDADPPPAAGAADREPEPWE
ncbi:MAG: Sec-independent protein translocase subunit TatA/TatB [Ilumatobacteraceae bacterium]